jgi:hypothetical protein
MNRSPRCSKLRLLRVGELRKYPMPVRLFLVRYSTRTDRASRRSLPFRRRTRAFLFGVAPIDPAALAAACAVLALAALLAAYIPARRAAAVDPLVALRWE